MWWKYLAVGLVLMFVIFASLLSGAASAEGQRRNWLVDVMFGMTSPTERLIWLWVKALAFGFIAVAASHWILYGAGSPVGLGFYALVGIAWVISGVLGCIIYKT